MLAFAEDEGPEKCCFYNQKGVDVRVAFFKRRENTCSRMNLKKESKIRRHYGRQVKSCRDAR